MTASLSGDPNPKEWKWKTMFLMVHYLLMLEESPLMTNHNLLTDTLAFCTDGQTIGKCSPSIFHQKKMNNQTYRSLVNPQNPNWSPKRLTSENVYNEAYLY